MISLNTYSFGLAKGLARGSKKKMKFHDFVNFCLKNDIESIEFPLDFFSKIEKKNFESYFNILKKNKLKAIIDLEEFNSKNVKELVHIHKYFEFEIIRIKMSNFFGGNRYLVKNFNKKKLNFTKKIKKLIKIIDGTNIRFAIENHQDLNSKELIEIIKQTSVKKVGINWDIANSLATIETPDEFFRNAKNYIINVHSKDYKIIKSDKGFFLKRCVIGSGIVNFTKVFEALSEIKYQGRFTLETCKGENALISAAENLAFVKMYMTRFGLESNYEI